MWTFSIIQHDLPSSMTTLILFPLGASLCRLPAHQIERATVLAADRTVHVRGWENGQNPISFAAWLELNPNSWFGQYELGKLELYRMHLDAALDAARTAVTLAPDQPKVYHLLSLIHLRQKNYQAAVADLDAYIKLDPNSPDGQTAKQIRADTEHKVDNSHP